MTKVDLPDDKVTLEKCSENDNGEAVTHLQNMLIHLKKGMRAKSLIK